MFAGYCRAMVSLAWRKLLTCFVLATLSVPMMSPPIEKAVGGDGRFIYLHGALLGVDRLVVPQHQVYDQSDGDVLDLDNDEQTPQDDHFNVIVMALTPSFDLAMDMPVASYSVVSAFAPLSRISSPLLRPPRAFI